MSSWRSWSVGVVEWWSGGVVEWWSGGVTRSEKGASKVKQ